MQVRFDAVTKQFEDKRGTVVAVDNLSLTIESGKLVGLLGPSGCGKSTSLFMIAGIYPISSGRLWFDDTDATNLSPEKRGVGMVFQNYALYPHLTVRQNIEFPLVNSKEIKGQLKQELASQKEYGSLKALTAARMQEAAQLVEIEEYLDRKPAELSGGQQQRVAIARAIVKRPSLLLLDEPLSNLDVRLRIQTREEIKRIQRKTGITTVFVTHDHDEAMNICDEIVIMKKGVLQQLGAPQDIYDRPVNRFVAEFLGGSSLNMLEARIENGALLLGGYTLHRGLQLPDGAITIGIRPENLVLAEGPCISATVVQASRLGGVTTVEASIADGQSLRFFKDNRAVIAPGDGIQLAPLENTLYLFDQNGEKVHQL